MAMMHLLSECSPDSIIAEDRLLHELALLPSKNRVVQRNPLNLGSRGIDDGDIDALGLYALPWGTGAPASVHGCPAEPNASLLIDHRRLLRGMLQRDANEHGAEDLPSGRQRGGRPSGHTTVLQVVHTSA